MVVREGNVPPGRGTRHGVAGRSDGPDDHAALDGVALDRLVGGGNLVEEERECDLVAEAAGGEEGVDVAGGLLLGLLGHVVDEDEAQRGVLQHQRVHGAGRGGGGHAGVGGDGAVGGQHGGVGGQVGAELGVDDAVDAPAAGQIEDLLGQPVGPVGEDVGGAA